MAIIDATAQSAPSAELAPPPTVPFTLSDLQGLERALNRLLEIETSDWPTPERHVYVEQLEHLRHEVRKRLHAI